MKISVIDLDKDCLALCTASHDCSFFSLIAPFLPSTSPLLSAATDLQVPNRIFQDHLSYHQMLQNMSFITAEQVRTALNNADRAIHGAIHDGTLVEVMAALSSDLVSVVLSLFSVYLLTTTNQGGIFQAKKTGHFAAEFKEKRYLFECCQAYVLAQNAGTLDGTFLKSQRTGLSNFLEKETAKKEKAKAKDTLRGEGKSTGQAPPKDREQQPVAGPSRIRATSPLPRHEGKAVPKASGAESTLPGGAGGAGPSTHRGAGRQKAGGTGAPRHDGGERSTTDGAAGPEASPPVPQRTYRPFPYDTLPPMKVSQPRFHRVALPKAPRIHGPPTDEMSRLSVRETQEGAKEGARRPHRRLASLEMEVDEEDRTQGPKRKRGDRRVDSDGEEEKEDDEDEDMEERKVKRPRARASKMRIVKRTGKFYNPACKPCNDIGARCEKQERNWACCRCAEKKVGCRRGQSEKRRNARESGPEDDDDDDEPSDAVPLARHRAAVPRKRLDRKGKGKGESFFYHIHPSLTKT